MTEEKKRWGRLRRLRCKISGHEWERVPYTSVFNSVVGQCSRCGKEATGLEAATMTADGSGPPASLLKQDAKEELQAHYLDGDIDEEELEMLMEEALEGDDE